MGKPSLEQRQECVSQVEDIMPIALGRVYAQHILPSGYKVSSHTTIIFIMHLRILCDFTKTSFLLYFFCVLELQIML